MPLHSETFVEQPLFNADIQAKPAIETQEREQSIAYDPRTMGQLAFECFTNHPDWDDDSAVVLSYN